MNKFDMIDYLEGKEVQVPSGQYCPIKNGRLHTDFGQFKLINHSVSMLEAFCKTAREIEK